MKGVVSGWEVELVCGPVKARQGWVGSWGGGKTEVWVLVAEPEFSVFHRAEWRANELFLCGSKGFFGAAWGFPEASGCIQEVDWLLESCWLWSSSAGLVWDCFRGSSRMGCGPHFLAFQAVNSGTWVLTLATDDLSHSGHGLHAWLDGR